MVNIINYKIGDTIKTNKNCLKYPDTFGKYDGIRFTIVALELDQGCIIAESHISPYIKFNLYWIEHDKIYYRKKKLRKILNY